MMRLVTVFTVSSALRFVTVLFTVVSGLRFYESEEPPKHSVEEIAKPITTQATADAAAGETAATEAAATEATPVVGTTADGTVPLNADGTTPVVEREVGKDDGIPADGATTGSSGAILAPGPVVPEGEVLRSLGDSLPIPPNLAMKFPPRPEDLAVETQPPVLYDRDGSKVNSFEEAGFKGLLIAPKEIEALSKNAESTLEHRLEQKGKLLPLLPTAAGLPVVGNVTTHDGSSTTDGSEAGRRLPGGSAAVKEKLNESLDEKLKSLGEETFLGPNTENAILEDALNSGTEIMKPKNMKPEAPIPGQPPKTMPDPLAAYGEPPYVSLSYTDNDLTPLTRFTLNSEDKYPLLHAADAELAVNKTMKDDLIWDSETNLGKSSNPNPLPSTDTEGEMPVKPVGSLESGAPPVPIDPLKVDLNRLQPELEETSEEDQDTLGSQVGDNWSKQDYGRWIDNFASRTLKVTANTMRRSVESQVQAVIDDEIEKAFPPPAPPTVSIVGSGSIPMVGSGSGSGIGSSGSGSGWGSGSPFESASGPPPSPAAPIPVVIDGTTTTTTCPPVDVPNIIVSAAPNPNAEQTTTLNDYLPSDLFPIGVGRALAGPYA